MRNGYSCAISAFFHIDIPNYCPSSVATPRLFARNVLPHLATPERQPPDTKKPVFPQFHFQPIICRLSAPKFTFFTKFCELIPLKTPIYIKGSRGKYRISTNSELRLSNFLTISCLLIARRFDLQPGSLCDQLLAILGSE